MKIKFRGQRVAVRLLADEDIIGERCLYRDKCHPDCPKSIKNDMPWRESGAIGDRVNEHPTREYVQIISPWFS